MKKLHYKKMGIPIFNKTTLCIAIGLALFVSSNSQATVTFNSTDIMWGTTTGTSYTFTATDTTTATIFPYYTDDTGTNNIFTVTENSSNVDIVATITAGEEAFGIAFGDYTVTDNLSYYPIYSAVGITGDAQIGTVTATLGSNDSYQLNILGGTFSAIKTTYDWTSLVVNGETTLNLENVKLQNDLESSRTFLAVDIHNLYTTTADYTTFTTPTATFNKDIVLYASKVNSGDQEQIMGLSVGLSAGGTAYAANVETASNVNVSVTVEDSNLADLRNLRGVSNEGGDVNITGNVSVTVTNTTLPDITISGVHADTKQAIYSNMNALYTSMGETDKVFVSNTTVGSITVLLESNNQTSDETALNAYGLNISTNTNFDGTAINNAVTGTTTVTGAIKMTVTGDPDPTGENANNAVRGEFGGYISSKKNGFGAYDQATMMFTNIGSIDVSVTNTLHSNVLGDSPFTNGIFGVNKGGLETLTISDGLSVYVAGASASLIEGIYQAGGTSTINNGIKVQIAAGDSDHSSQSGSAVQGIYATDGTLNANGGITVDVSSFTDGAIQGIYATGTATETDDATAPSTVIALDSSGVTVNATNVGSTQIQGIYIDGGDGTKFTMEGGGITMALTNLQGTGITGEDDQNKASHIEGISFNGSNDSTMTGDISITALAYSSSDFSQNIYGGVIPVNATGVTFNQTGNVSVTLEGLASFMNATGSIYGTVSGNTSSTEATRTYNLASSEYKRTLNFGDPDSGTVFISTTSIDTTYFKASFANFDEVVVNSGSILAIDNTQSSLQGDEEVFGDDFSEEDARLNGIVSAEGTMTIHSAADNNDVLPTFTVSSEAIAVVDTITDEGSVVNKGGLAIQTLTVEGTGSVTNTGSGDLDSILGDNLSELLNGDLSSLLDTSNLSSLINGALNGLLMADNVTVENSGTVTSDGSAVLVRKLTVEDTATVDIQDGYLVVPKEVTYNGTTYDGAAYLEGGTVNIGNSSNTVTALMYPDTDTPINSKVSVTTSAFLGLGDNSVIEDGTNALSDSGLSRSGKAVLVVDSPITTGGTGFIGVDYSGSTTQSYALATTSTSGIATVSTTASNPGLYFGADSILVVSAGTENGSAATNVGSSEAAFTANEDGISAGATVDIVGGAKVVLYGDIQKGRYNITKDYVLSADTIKGWDDTSGDVYAAVVDASGITWTFYRGYDIAGQDGAETNYVYLDVLEHEDVQNVYPDVNIPEIANDDLDYCSSGDAGAQYVCNVLRDQGLDTAQKTEIINSSSLMPFLGGVMSVAMNDMAYGFGELYNHLTMDSDTFGATGNLWPYKENNNFWLDVIGHWTISRKLNGTGLSGAKYHDSTFGFIIGYDRKIENRPFAVGGAFSFLDGNLKSGGNGTRTKNDHQSYGLHIWANYSPNEHLNLIGSLHWLHNNAGLTQYINKSYASQASGHVSTDMFAIGLRAETTIRVGDAVNIIPHVEPRYIYGKSHAFDTKVDGQKIWRTKFGGNSLFQIPVGVAVRADFLTESGWNWRPNLDVSVIPQAGCTKQKMTVTNFNNVSDIIYGEYQGKFAAEAKIGVSVDKGPWTFGAKYGVGGGTKGRIEHGFILQGRLRW